MSTEGTPATAGAGSSTGLVQIGCYLIIGVFVIFELIARDYFVTNVALVVAIAVLALPRLAPKAIGALPAFTKVGGYLLAFAGAIEFLDDIRFDAYDGFLAIVGALVAYVAYVAAFLGARSIDL